MAVLQWINAVAFSLLGLLAFRTWRRHRTTSAAWLAAGFGVLGLALLLGRLVTERGPVLALALAALSTVAVVGFPYALFRFTSEFGGVGRVGRRLGDVAAAAVVGTTLVLLPAIVDEQQPPWLPVLLLAIVAYWTVLTAWVVARLWLGGRGRPTVARRRMRTLALAAGVLNIAVFIALAVPGSGDVLSATAQALVILSAVGFYLAFSPPGLLRREWRRDDESRLQRAHADLLRADDRTTAAEALLPSVAGLFGSSSAGFLDADLQPVATQAMSDEDLQAVAESLDDLDERGRMHQRGDWHALRLGVGWLVVRADRFAPFFGSEERQLLESISGVLDLAFGRVDLLAAERAARAQVEASSKELETLLYGISHDLRNPLVSVLGYVDVLEEDHRDAVGAEGRHYLGRIASNARYMDELIGDLLEFSRVGRAQRSTEPVALSPLVEDIAEGFRGKRPAATIDVGTLPVVEMNPARARQLFTNLIGNALQHGGRDDITVRVTSVEAPDGSAVVSVRDDGQGIPETFRKRVFRIFERLEPPGSGGGTGIGLAMCQRIVEQVGGRIWVADADAGADLRVQLPPESLGDRSAAEVSA